MYRPTFFIRSYRIPFPYYTATLILLLLLGSPARGLDDEAYVTHETFKALQKRKSDLDIKIAHQELVLKSQRELLRALRGDAVTDLEETTFVCEPHTLSNKTDLILQDTFTAVSGFTGLFGPSAEIRRNYIEIFKKNQPLRHSHFGWATLSLGGSTLFLVHVAINPEEAKTEKEVNAVPSSTNIFMQGSIITLLIIFRLGSAWLNRAQSP